MNAAHTSLEHRGDGTGSDGDAGAHISGNVATPLLMFIGGWEKVWRAAAWAQFEDSEAFYHLLTVRFVYPSVVTPLNLVQYAIERNFGETLWSLYNPFDEDAIFQIGKFAHHFLEPLL